MTDHAPQQDPHHRSSDASFGVIPIRYKDRHWQVLLVQHRQGHWAFPKGHPNPHESHATTACRELFEETQCRVLRFLQVPAFTETYQFRAAHRMISKTVTYFLAEVDGDPQPQPEELKAASWFPLREADQKATFDKCRKMLLQVNEWLGDRLPDQLPGRPELRVAPWEGSTS
jgi:bis(5'-nucleosidyl)-tetraphosphatase